MLTIQPNQFKVIAFDGLVLEVFPETRKHISQLRDFELRTDRHGKHSINIADIYSGLTINVDEEAIPKVNRLIAEVNRARAEFKFD